MRQLSDGKAAAIRYSTRPPPMGVLYSGRPGRPVKVDPGILFRYWPRWVVTKVAELPIAEADPRMAPAPFVLIVPVDVMLLPLT